MGYYIKAPYRLAPTDDEYEQMASSFVDMFDTPTQSNFKQAIDQSIVEHQDINTIIDMDKLKSLLGFDNNISELGDMIDDMLDQSEDDLL